MDTMSPSGILDWLASHGGQAGPEQHDARGRTIWAAQDGASITVVKVGGSGTREKPDQYQVVSKQESGATANAAPSASTPPAAAGGGKVAQSDELNSPEQWIDDPDLLKNLTPPSGIDVSTGNYYANVKTYRDGRKVIEWYQHGTGTPGKKDDPVLATTSGTDTTLRDKWEASQRADAGAAARGDQEGDVRPAPATSPIREAYHNGKWVTEPNPLYQAGQADWHTEGTPDGQGGFDNSRPIMVRTVNGKRETRQPTSAELKDWNEAAQRTRNPGGKTDAEIEAQQPKSGEVKAPVKERPGWTSVTRSKVEGGRTVEATTYIDPNGNEVDTLPPVNQEESGSYRKNPETGQLEHVIKTVTPTGTSTTYKPVLPSERTQVGSKTITNGQKTTKVITWELPDGSRMTTDESEETITAPYPAGTPTFRPDWQKPGMGAWEYAAEVRKFQRENPGALSDKQAAELIGEGSASAKAEAERLNTILGVQQNIYSNESGERNADVSAQTSRRGQAVSIANQAASSADSMRGYAKHGSDTAGKAQIAQMVLGTALAQIMGGGNVARTELSPMMRQIKEQTLPGAEIKPSSVPTAEQLRSGFNPMQAAQAGQAGAPPIMPGPTPPLGQGQDLSTPQQVDPNDPLGMLRMGTGAFDGISLFNHL
jgi:hypothetical protein